MRFVIGMNAKSTAWEATRNEALIICPPGVAESLGGCMEPSQSAYVGVEVLQNSEGDFAGILHQPM